MVEQGVAGGEHPVRQPVVAHEWLDIFLPAVCFAACLPLRNAARWFSSGHLDGGGMMGMFSGMRSLAETCRPV